MDLAASAAYVEADIQGPSTSTPDSLGAVTLLAETPLRSAACKSARALSSILWWRAQVFKNRDSQGSPGERSKETDL
ncbi:hypothetical protein L915_00351, partial [Phytophthora nicotianae]